MEQFRPNSPEQLAECLAGAATAGKRIRLEGNNSKARLGGPIPDADVLISTAALDQVLMFEPKDLTMSVGAGLPYARFTELLDQNGMMVPLDPPYAANATVGGVIAANSSGPRRRLYGTARDLVIGMKFATLEGKIIQSGGMVVKNVAGLDMAKLLIGSLGTLAAMAVINFKLAPKPQGSLTFLFEHATAKAAAAQRDRILQGVLQPTAVDLLNPAASAIAGRKTWTLAVAVSGNAAVLDRYKRELGGEPLASDMVFWQSIQEFTPRFLALQPEGCMVRTSVTLQDLAQAMEKLPGAVVARAANGVCYAHLDTTSQAAAALSVGRAVMEFGPASRTAALKMWPVKDTGFPMMEKIKQMFDPKHLLNRGRFYGDI